VSSYYQRNGHQIRAKRRAYHQRNRERENEARRHRYRANAEAERARAREYYQRNRQACQRRHQQWYARNREREIMRRRIQRAVDKGAHSTMTLKAWNWLKRHWRYRCAYCGAEETLTERLTLDHVVPLSRGGADVVANVVPACARCNCAKGEQHAAGWMAKQGYDAEGFAATLEAAAELWENGSGAEEDAA